MIVNSFRTDPPQGAAPTFSSAPTIIGTPTVGVPVAFVSGTANGSPSPTLTQQWLLDGSPISGATGSTYTPVVGDVGANRLSVRQTATNGVGSPATSTSSSVSVASAAAPTVLSISVDSSGTILSTVHSVNVTHGSGGTGGATISPSGGAATLTYLDGAGTTTIRRTISRAIQASETLTSGYTQPGNGVEAVVGGADLATYSGASVTNGSTQGSAVLTSFTLTSAASTGTHPFTLGVAFKQGDVPSSFTTDLTNCQVRIMRTWNDGSVKHAIVSGRAALTQNVARTVNITVGAPPTGTALTATSIQTAAPSASIQCGALGTVNLSALLASPVRTFVSGHEMVECHYRGALGTGDLSAWFHVRLFADGRMWVRAIVENGYIDNVAGTALANTANQTYVPTLTINGATVYNNGGASLTHYANTRYMAEAWIGTDPQITPALNAAYLRSTKLVPNHSVAASTTMLNALDQTYLPMTGGGQNPDMGGTGYAPGIGLLPNWNAAYVTSADARAFRSTLANSSSLNSFGIVWRSQVTQVAAKPSAYPTWTVLATSAGGGSDGNTRGALSYERNHAPGEGYLAYLLTGDYWHLETLSMQASYLYLSINSNRGSGTSRVPDTGQTRGYAWTLRTWGLYAAIAPDSDMGAGGVGADYRALVANAYTSLQTTKNSGVAMANLGSLFQSIYSGWPTNSSAGANVTGTIAPWMSDFMVGVHGFLSDAQPLTTTAAQIEVRDWSYRFVVGRCGPSADPNSFSFTQAAQYGIKVSSGSPFDSNWYPTWGEVWTQSMGSANNTASNTLTGGNIEDSNGGMQSFWGNLMPALMYAVDHEATGAAAAYLRLTGATNWSTITSNQANNPVWSVMPRTTPAAVPSWLGAVGEWTALPNSSLTASGVGWTGTNPGATQGVTGNYRSVIQHWGSGVMANRGVFRNGSFVSGPHMAVFGGGHNNYGGNEIYAYGPLTGNSPTWARLRDPTVPGPVNVARDGSGNPGSTHTYDSLQYLDAQQKLICFGIGAVYPSGNSVNGGNLYDFTVDPNAVQPWSGIDAAVPSQGGAGYIYYRSAIDLLTGYFWGIGVNNDPSKLTRYDPATGAATHWTINNPNSFSYTNAAIDPINKIMVFAGQGTMRGMDLRAPTNGQNTYTIATTGTGPAANDNLGLQWDVGGNRFLAWAETGKTLYFLTPSSSPYSGGTAWTWTSVTPAGGATPSGMTPSGSIQEGRYINGRMRIVEGGSWRGVMILPNEVDGGFIYRLS